jgi:hypothetical protein
VRAGPKREITAELDTSDLPPSGPRRVDAFAREYLQVTRGKGARGPFRLRQWQKAIVGRLFPARGPCPRQALLSLPRGNGKTSAAAVLGACGLYADGVRLPLARLFAIACRALVEDLHRAEGSGLARRPARERVRAAGCPRSADHVRRAGGAASWRRPPWRRIRSVGRRAGHRPGRPSVVSRSTRSPVRSGSGPAVAGARSTVQRERSEWRLPPDSCPRPGWPG